MTKTRLFSLLAAVIVGSLGANSRGEPIELLKHGDFEEAKGDMPAGWQKGNAGVISLTDNAFQGKHACAFKAVPHEWGYSYFNTPENAFGIKFPRPGIPVAPGGLYEISMMARGSGAIGFVLPCSSRVNFLSSVFSPDYPLAFEWRKYTFKFKVEDPRACSLLAGIKLTGVNAVADIDKVSLTFDPVANPGIDPGIKAEVVRNDAAAMIEARDAELAVFVNGKAAPERGGKRVLELVEGFNTIAVEATAKGANPGVRIVLPDYPETTGRWRVGAAGDDAWRTAGFDDGKWPVASPGKDAFMWAADAKAGKALFRQTLLWNKTHYGSNRCILPQIRNWGFSPATVETFVSGLVFPAGTPGGGL